MFGTSSRLNVAIFLSVILHAIVLFGVSFQFPSTKNEHAALPLEVVLINRNSISSLAAILSLVLCFVQPSVRAEELEPRWAAAAASGDGLPVVQFSMNYGKVSFGYGQWNSTSKANS